MINDKKGDLAKELADDWVHQDQAGFIENLPQFINKMRLCWDNELLE